MPQMNFGMILREARERRGYDLAEAARRLRIRPDILLAIEECDFSRMPPRGYTRNMVNAYARLVGLNPTELTRMYLDEAYAFQVGRARSDARPNSRFDMGGGSTRSSARGSRTSSRSRSRDAYDDDDRSPRANAFGRVMYDDRREYSRDPGASGRLYPAERTHQSRHSALPTSQYTNFYAGPKAPSALQSKLPVLIAIAVIALLLIVVLVLVFGNRDGGEDVPKIPVAGVDDTTGTSSGSGDTQVPVVKPTEVAPLSVEVVYKVASGQEAYAVIVDNGSTEELMLSGPSEKSYDVSGTWSMATWNIEAVTVTVDGKEVPFDGYDASGMPLCTVDFNQYLADWYQQHPNAERPAISSGDSSAGDTNAGGDTGDTGDANAGDDTGSGDTGDTGDAGSDDTSGGDTGDANAAA